MGEEMNTETDSAGFPCSPAYQHTDPAGPLCNPANAHILRTLPFEGGDNFRDLGGYPAAEEKHVKYGLLYRGSMLHSLQSDADREALRQLDLHMILDLRSREEAETRPDFIPEGADYLQISAMRYNDGEDIDYSPAGMKRLEQEISKEVRMPGQDEGQDERQDEGQDEGQDDPPPSAMDIFKAYYARMPFCNPAFQTMFRLLEQGKVPLLFHCTSGKDRTGVAAMLILLALGADRETIIADYMETNRIYASEIKELEKNLGSLRETNPEEWNLRLIGYGVIRECAEVTLNAILRRYGSPEAYFLKEFGLDKRRLTLLRAQYLE